MSQKELHITCEICGRPLAEIKTAEVVRIDDKLICELHEHERQSYLDLADEMNDYDVGPWVESDWDKTAVRDGKAFADRNNLSWPPQTGDYDRYYLITIDGKVKQ